MQGLCEESLNRLRKSPPIPPQTTCASDTDDSKFEAKTGTQIHVHKTVNILPARVMEIKASYFHVIPFLYLKA